MDIDTDTEDHAPIPLLDGLRQDVEFARALAALLLAAKLEYTRGRAENARDRIVPPRWAT